MGLFGTAFEALKWGFGTNFKHIGRWLLLTILSIIPIINFFADGALLKVLKGEEPTIPPAGKSFVNGLLLFIIALIYMLIPIIIYFVIGGAAMLPAITGGDVGAAIGASVGIIGLVLTVVVMILFALIMIPAEINFARSGKFGKAFAFSEIFAMIKKLGWGKYILAIIVMIIFAIVLGLILGLIMMIPILGLIIYILAFIPLVCFELKYWNDVFA
ncbi:MAG TPA: DUF4013 domain-containing protein [Methanocorpusculum sp.]|nr:DUF4013 domain-containing protein [Methanocorpusculum sp.]